MALGHELLVSRGTSLQAPISAQAFRKAAPPPTGDRYGNWGPGAAYSTRMPGGSAITFDLSRLSLADYRMMRDNYQISASLNVLLFLVAQSDWSIECENKKIADEIEEGIREYWFPLIRSLGQAYWAGFSPIVTVWELNDQSKTYRVTGYKDLVPEDTRVHWQKTHPNASQGRSGPTIYTYDGIDSGQEKPIPAEVTLWYPLLMENGDMYGRKLLKPAFPAWFYSQLMHLFTNRYFERFGEPTAIGRYPADDTVPVGDGTSIPARQAMEEILTNLRSRGVVSMPSMHDENGNPEWDIEYMESQMRGVDFDRYIERLDEEMSLALFTPVLLFRNSHTGSYNLGTQHMTVFQWMLNALFGDMKHYLDKYLIARLKDVNFGPNAPKAQIRFRSLGRLTDEGARSILLGLIQNGAAKLDNNGLADLGDFLGLGLDAIQTLTEPPAVPGAPAAKSADPNAPANPRAQGKSGGKSDTPSSKALVRARARLEEQIQNLYSTKSGHDLEVALGKVKLGFKGQFVNELATEQELEPAVAEQVFSALETKIVNALPLVRSPKDALAKVAEVYTEFGVTDA
jgi:hypothetical protein